MGETARELADALLHVLRRREPFTLQVVGALQADRTEFLNALNEVYRASCGGELVYFETPGGSVHVEFLGGGG